jgi:hypothetical protein
MFTHHQYLYAINKFINMANPTENKAVALNIIPPIALLLPPRSSPPTVSFDGTLTDVGATARGLRVGTTVGAVTGSDAETGIDVGDTTGATGANVVAVIGNGVGGTSGATVAAVTGKGVGGVSGADVATATGTGAVVVRTGNGVGAARGAEVVAVTGRGDGGGMVVPTGAEIGTLTGAGTGTVPPVLSIQAPVASKPTQSPTNRLEQSK